LRESEKNKLKQVAFIYFTLKSLGFKGR